MTFAIWCLEDQCQVPSPESAFDSAADAEGMVARLQERQARSTDPSALKSYELVEIKPGRAARSLDDSR
jgi:hypothetical protein